jgi:excinuclease UvrABC nuclease subunit
LGSYISAHGEINDEVKEDYENAVYFVSNDLKKIKKKERQELFGFLDNALESYIVSTSLQEENLLNESLSTLQTRYNLPSFPYRIECIDISHLSGGWMSG